MGVLKASSALERRQEGLLSRACVDDFACLDCWPEAARRSRDDGFLEGVAAQESLTDLPPQKAESSAGAVGSMERCEGGAVVEGSRGKDCAGDGDSSPLKDLGMRKAFDLTNFWVVVFCHLRFEARADNQAWN